MTVYIGGTFDLLHKGHIELFKRAKQFGKVVVSLNTDEFATRYKRKPIMDLGERFILVSACKYVDRVVVNWGDEDSKPAILRSGADIILHGDDWTGEKLMKQMSLTQEWLDKHKIRMEYLPYTKGISTSELIKRNDNSSNTQK